MPPLRLGTASDGFIVPLSLDAPLSSAVAERARAALRPLLSHAAPGPQSVYLDLSVPAPALELVAIFSDSPSAEARRTLAEGARALERAPGGCSWVQVDALSVREALDERSGALRFWLRHCAVLLHGPALPLPEAPVRPSWALAAMLFGTVGEETQRAVDALLASDEERTRRICRRLARRLVLAAFGVVMSVEESWTTDLEQCASLFAAHHPRWKDTVRELVALAEHPTTDRDAIARPAVALGSWLAAEYARARQYPTLVR